MRGGVGALVELSLEVDSTGRPVPGTMIAGPPADLATAAQYADFMRAVAQAAARWRFRPAAAGGCSIRARIVMPTTFAFPR